MEKKRITLKPLHHRGNAQLGIEFEYDVEVKNYIKTYQGIKWSQTHKMFYVLDTADQRNNLLQFLRRKGFYVDYTALRKPARALKVLEQRPAKPDKLELYKPLPKEHKQTLHNFIQYLKGKRHSESTVQTYGYFVLRFLHFLKEHPRTTWDNEKIRLFIEKVVAKEKYSISSHRQSISALKHFTELCGIGGFDASEIARPKKSRYLPTILSKEEIIDIIQCTKNLKHRAVIALIYSSGLRISEMINLELMDLDFDRSQIRIRNAKGRKDRVVVMAEIVKPLINNYINTYRPTRFVIEGRAGERYSDSSVRAFLKASCKAAGIKKRVTPHTLRHSYATHMMEQGVDLRHIQELLGHAKPETTMIYTHVAQKNLMKVQSPLDVVVKAISKNYKNGQKVLLSGNG